MDLAYDIGRTWEENSARGPRLPADPPVVPETPWKTVLGLPVRSRLGIAAGLLLNSGWVEAYARFGWDILTYKTVRSVARASYPLPNWVFVEEDGTDGPVHVREELPGDLGEASSAVCFGMPSVGPELWRPDVRQARAALGSGQILLVSVVATPSTDASGEEMGADFARCASWAVESGAHVIEANFSCPNVCSAEGTLYHDTVLSRQIARQIRGAIGSTPLLLKIGAFADAARQGEFLRAVNGVVNGITLVNAISRPVLQRDGRPAFGPRFLRAGVLGRAIHEPSVLAARQARSSIEQDHLDLEILAVGGASRLKDFADFFEAGVSAVLCGSSPMYLPELAIEAKRAHPGW